MSRQQNAVMAEIRRHEILELLKAEGHATVNALCDRFGVSPATVRNDLNALEAAGQLRRTHGGAISLHALPELTSREKAGLRISEKQSIARRALEFVRDGDVIAIDTGTTTMELARLLTEMRRLTVITNDLKIAAFLEDNSEATVILLGGPVRKGFHCAVGAAALMQLAQYHIDVLFLATNAVDCEWGLSTPDIETADIKREMIQNAHRRVLLADSSKIGRRALARFARPEDIDVLITDPGAEDEFLREMEKKNIELICAS